MSIFLTVLKVLLGIVLALLFVVILLVLLILFFPVRYGKMVHYDENFTYDIALTWFFRCVYVEAKSETPEDVKVKLLWLYNVPKGEGLLALLKKIWNWFYPRAFYIIQSIYEDEQIASDPSLLNSAKLLGECIKGILGAILPKDLKGNVCYGLSSPDKTGYLTAALSTVFQGSEHLELMPDFTESGFSCHLDFSAKVQLYQVVKYLLKILCSKDIKRFLTLITEKYQREVNYGE